MAIEHKAWMDAYDWTNGLDLTVGGLGWQETEREASLDRLPLFMKEVLPSGTWALGTQSAGIYLQFRTSAQTVVVRWEMEPAITHGCDPFMALSGGSGVDLYGRDGLGRWRWVGAKDPYQDPQANGRLTRLLLDGIERDYRLYLPLLRRTRFIDIGADAPIHPGERDERLPVVYYGTSIVHGAGVSRPGCGHAQQLGMALDCDLLNLGFCGSAKCEVAMAECLGKQPARLWLIDPLPNNDVKGLYERLPRFLEILGRAQPQTPILLVEERLFADAAFMPQRGQECRAKNRALALITAERRALGQTGLEIVPMGDYYGDNGSTDSNHPNDLGAFRLFERLHPHVERALAGR